jgi:hypothetical protein
MNFIGRSQHAQEFAGACSFRWWAQWPSWCRKARPGVWPVTLPVVRSRFTQPIAVLMPIPNCLAAWLHDNPPLFASSWRARQQQKSQPRNAAGEIFVVGRAKRLRTFFSASCGAQEMSANWRQKA